jgi:subtilisin family serine protease
MRTVAKLALVALVLSSLQAVPVGAAAPPQAEMERFIVVLEDGIDPYGVARKAMGTTGGKIGFIYEHSINGFALEMPAAAVPGLAHMPGVASIEPDVAVSVAAQDVSTGYDRIEADLNPSGADYSGIDIAIIDTGIWYDTGASQSHEDLKLSYVTDCTGAILYPMFGSCTPGGVDGHGHGTHVAGIAAACDNDIGSRGVASCATLWSFKALDDSGSGYLGSILAAVDLVTANADKIDVVNMSLSFAGESQALTDAINASVAQGVVFVVAAGNDSADASLYSPASIDSAITVSSVTDYDGIAGGLAQATCYADTDDELAAYSNFGSKVDIAAPGTCIYSTWLDNTYATISGTSMASPAVAGAVARYLHDGNMDLTTAAEVAAVRDALVNGGMPQNGTCGFGGDGDGLAEPLLFLNGPAFGGDGTCEGGGAPVDDPPTAVIGTPSCTDLTCTFDGSGSSDDVAIVSYEWDFGDTTTATGATATHTYAGADSYTVTLTVTDGNGASNTDATTVTVTEPPQGDIPITTGVDLFSYDGTWATVVFFVTTLDFQSVAGAEATGTWTYQDRRGRTKYKSVTETSDAGGLVTIETRFKGTLPLEFCIDDITKPGYVYVPSPVFSCTTNITSQARYPQ